MSFDAIVIGSGQAGVPLATRLHPNARRRTAWSVALGLLLALMTAALVPAGAAGGVPRVREVGCVGMTVSDLDGHALLLAEPRSVLARPGWR